ncbi:MAG: hypothetical protein V3V13_09535 [Paracoccaceae bacterium]
MFSTISYDPLVAPEILGAVALLALAFLLLAIWLGLRGWAFRALAAVLLLGALLNPSYRQEHRTPLSDIVFVVVDKTASQTLPERTAQIDRALPDILAKLARNPDDPLEVINVPVSDPPAGATERGTFILRALHKAASTVSADRIAGAIILSDGRIHDLNPPRGFPAPVHLLLTGRAQDWDRRIILEDAPAFGFVDETVGLTLRIEDSGAVPSALGPAKILASVDGGETQVFQVPVGESITLSLTVEHAGINLLDITTPGIETELTTRNNRIIHKLTGVQDRLRVLLVSGEPYVGERTWRNLLKADAAVDLVHFTILRPPGKQDNVPVNELSLIAFPTRELFMDKIKDFDLIIFDRYRKRGILPDIYLENVAQYIRNGGAVLVASGPAFATVESLARSPLQAVLPVLPTGRIIEEGYLPEVTKIGHQHPVTATLAGQVLADGTPNWGRWFRLIEMQPRAGHVVMKGLGGRPLLVLDRVEKGRIAVLASDQAWLWSRGFEGGGPQLELLRRLAHWLMKEPELEEEILLATATGKHVVVERRSLGGMASDIIFTNPNGATGRVPLLETGPGQWRAEFEATENGIYRISDGALSAVVAVGPASPREFERPVGVSEALQTLAINTGGGNFQLASSTPDIRRTRPGRVAKGPNWLGLPKRGAYTVEDIRLTPLTPGWLILLLVAALSITAWRIEGR